MTEQRALTVCEWLALNLITPVGWKAKRVDIDRIDEHLAVEHEINFKGRPYSEKIFDGTRQRHFAALDRGDMCIVNGQLQMVK